MNQDNPKMEDPGTGVPDAAVGSADIPSSPTNKDPATRILRKGDLVRIAPRHGPRIKSRDGGLGRILRVIPVDGEDYPHRFDVDWVLGGRLANAHRSELVWTTADAEGMTGEAPKRARKPKVVQAPSPPEPKKKVTAKKKKAPAKKGTAAKGKAAASKKKGKAAAAASGKGALKRKQPAGGGKGGTTKRTKVEEPVADENDLDLYDRHRKEFERQITRLEKLDAFGFFLGSPPPEFQENYDDADEMNETPVEGNGSSGTKPPLAASPQLPPPDEIFPSFPPFNWESVRRRHNKGRYILDRVRQAEDERKRIRQTEGGDKPDACSKHLVALVNARGVHWEVFRQDVIGMCDSAIARDPLGITGGSGTLGHAANKTKNALEQIYDKMGKRQMKELTQAESRRKFSRALETKANAEAAMQGKWRQKPFPERQYERLTSNVVCAGLSELDERSAKFELQTSLPDSFVGLSYIYNDTGQSEGWMKSVLDETSRIDRKKSKAPETSDGDNEHLMAEALAADNGVVRAQVQATMNTLLIAVQDRVMTDGDVLHRSELRSANWEEPESDDNSIDPDSNNQLVYANGPLGSNGEMVSNPIVGDSRTPDSPDLVEQPVWGLDCYTRRNITTCLEVEFDPEIALDFIERWLLPAINACPIDFASNLVSAIRILEGLPLPSKASSLNKDNMLVETDLDVDCDERWSHSLLGKALKAKMESCGPPWLKIAARRLREAIGVLGHDFFRVHPKGHGSIVLRSKLEPNTLVTYYRGEVYPSWRWGEKLDAIEMAQTRLGLRPNLPDFYNMALERPQADPRGYGLLFVDASRKAGHGSSLSHSCDPTCEVRVAARHGKLCLAMTTLREVELGEELTFDYNAVTESLNEYRSAICLCGHGKCRGSFLHFATAECYQQVFNRNSPIAVRFSSLVKGSMKQVMSDADAKILQCHGFGTAAFGAVGMNYNKDSDNLPCTRTLDSMDSVPIWLRTYVADTLRYIEYERRALPIALLCNHLEKENPGNESTGTGKDTSTSKKPSSDGASKKRAKKDGGETPFDFFAREQKPFFKDQLVQQGFNLKGKALEQAISKVASSAWDALGVDLKRQWKARSIAKLKAVGKKANKKDKNEDAPKKAKRQAKNSSGKIEESETAISLAPSKISFEAADAEGASAMEQRIQQLTQALSRVGRILDRHRESSSASLSVHSPLSVMTDDDVIDWIWNHKDGVVQSLLRSAEAEKCVSPSLLLQLSSAVSQFASVPHKNREQLNLGLLKLRDILLNGIVSLEAELKTYELERDRWRSKKHRREKKRKEEEEKRDELSKSQIGTASDVVSEVSSVLKQMVDSVVDRVEGISPATVAIASQAAQSSDLDLEEPRLSRWLEHYQNRWKLEAASDLLLFYACTSSFFSLKPYNALKSTPIEVYARELGNSVPRSVVEVARESDNGNISKSVLMTKTGEVGNEYGGADPMSSQGSQSASDPQISSATTAFLPKKTKGSKFCEPDEVITQVTVDYQGDFVLAQLLQWYNGGIGQKPGLPDLIGCVELPGMPGCWNDIVSKGGAVKKLKANYYRSEIRPLLISWVENPRKRGDPFPDSLRHIFSATKVAGETQGFTPFGSPVLDFLVRGDDQSLQLLLGKLKEQSRPGECKNKPEPGAPVNRLQSSVDEGMPAQAVANWVQCENPACLKWRKVPWHVDIDALPEKFYCSDNKWNLAANTCDSPEDQWDENDSTFQNGGVEKESDKKMLEDPVSAKGSVHAKEEPKIKEADFTIGARFDVLRTNRAKKKICCTGIVIDLDLSGATKRVKFHFAKVAAKFDEWIDVGSPRIAPLNSTQSIVKDLKINDPVGPKTTKPKKDPAPITKFGANGLTTENNPIGLAQPNPAIIPSTLRLPVAVPSSAVLASAQQATDSSPAARKNDVDSPHTVAVQAMAQKISYMSGAIAESMIEQASGKSKGTSGAVDATTLAKMVTEKSTQMADLIVRGNGHANVSSRWSAPTQDRRLPESERDSKTLKQKFSVQNGPQVPSEQKAKSSIPRKVFTDRAAISSKRAAEPAVGAPRIPKKKPKVIESSSSLVVADKRPPTNQIPRKNAAATSPNNSVPRKNAIPRKTFISASPSQSNPSLIGNMTAQFPQGPHRPSGRHPGSVPSPVSQISQKPIGHPRFVPAAGPTGHPRFVPASRPPHGGFSNRSPDKGRDHERRYR